MSSAIVICLPVTPDAREVVYPGSVKRRCVDCGREVWASPASQEATRTQDVVLVCVDCGADRVEKDPEPVAGMLVGTEREVRAWLRRN